MKLVSLNDESHFQLVSGLWKGERGPVKPAKVLRATNFAGDGLFDFSDVVELDVEERHFAERKLARGDIVVERSGGGPKQPVGRVALFVPPDDRPYFSSNFTTTLRVLDRNTFHPEYVALYLHALYLAGATETLQRATTGIRNLDWQEYLRFKVPVCSLDEQSELVRLIGGARTAYRIEHELMEVSIELKRAAMTFLFMRGMRGEAQKTTEIGLVPESWKVKRLDSLARVVGTRMAYSELESMQPARENDVRVIGIKVSDMNRAGNEAVLISAALEKGLDAKLAEYRCAPPGTIVFPKRGAAIATNKKRFTNSWSVFDPNVIGVVPGDSINPGYLFHWFQSFDLRTITEPGPTPQLNKKHLDPLLIPTPADAEEQREIAALLDAMDRKIALHRQKRAVLEELFQSLLHKLMPGESRVADLDLSVLVQVPEEVTT